MNMTFINGQLDYVLFLSESAFPLLAVACVLVKVRGHHRVPWGLVAGLGMALWAVQWCDLLLLGSVWVKILLPTKFGLMLLSVVLLLEIGRRTGTARHDRVADHDAIAKTHDTPAQQPVSVAPAGRPDDPMVSNNADAAESKLQAEQQAIRLERLQRQHQVTVKLVTDRSLANTDFRQAAQAVTKLVAGAMQTARVSIWMYGDDRQTITCVDLYDLSRSSHTRGAMLHAAKYPGYFGALATGRAIDAGDARHDARTCEFSADYLGPLGITSMLDAAIRVGGEITGVLCCEHVGPPRAWHDDEITFAGVIADQVAQLIVKRDREVSEQALRESELRLQTIVDAIQAGIIIVDAQNHEIVDVNPAALAMIGAQREEVLGHVCHSFVCPAEAGRCPVTDLNQVVDNAERVLVKADGGRMAILKTVVAITLHGRKHLLESFVDISARKAAEKELAIQRARLEEITAELTSSRELAASSAKGM